MVTWLADSLIKANNKSKIKVDRKYAEHLRKSGKILLQLVRDNPKQKTKFYSDQIEGSDILNVKSLLYSFRNKGYVYSKKIIKLRQPNEDKNLPLTFQLFNEDRRIEHVYWYISEKGLKLINKYDKQNVRNN